MTSAARPPAVAGSFYPADRQELTDALAASFLDPRGPGKLPVGSVPGAPRIRAAVVPHAGYFYSGPIAALAYARIAAAPPPEAVLVLGVDHHGAGSPFALSARPWTTPLGEVRPDPVLLDKLGVAPIAIDEAAHAREHSIEVQLPFLQEVLPGVPMVALQIRFGAFTTLRSLARQVRAAVGGRNILLLASTDLSHYVGVETARRLDGLALEAIVAGEPERLYRTVVEQEISMCGIAPTTVLLEILRGQAARPELLRWGHSGESEPMSRVVGYAALTFAAEAEPASEAVSRSSTYGSSPPAR
jgi:AmmeMemoRadiSam system protein B